MRALSRAFGGDGEPSAHEERRWEKQSSEPAELRKRRLMGTPFIRQTPRQWSCGASGRGCQAEDWAAMVMKINFFALLCGACDDFFVWWLYVGGVCLV